MELYFKNENGQLQETTLARLLKYALKEANLPSEHGYFSG